MNPALRGPVVLLAVAGLVLASCGGMDGPPPLQGDHEFTLVYSQSNFGNIEPCACNNRTTGGFPRRFAYLEAQRAAGKKLLVLDSGDSLFTEKYVSPEMAGQTRAKADAIAAAFAKSGVDAMTFGELDLQTGGNYLKRLVEEHDLPMVAANVKLRKSGDPLFEPYRMISLGDVKVAVIGLVAPEVRRIVSQTNEEGATMTTLSKEQHVFLEDLFEDKDVVIEDPIEVAREVVADVRGEAHVVIVLSHMSPRMTKEFAASVTGVDAIVGGHMPSNQPKYEIPAGVLVLSTPMNGTVLGVVDFDVRNGGLVFQDRTEVESFRERLPRLEALRDTIVGRHGTDVPEEIEATDLESANNLRLLGATIPDVERAIAEADAEPVSYFVHSHVTLDGQEYPDHPEMSDLVRSYRRGLADLYTDAAAEPNPAIVPAAGAQAYVKDVECIKCHRPQYEFWQNTFHARAWQTMLDYEAQYDLECIVCHTVGYMAPGGFDRPDTVAGYENVQCESCHGPGSFHLDGISFLDASKIDGDAVRMDCERCHNNEHSPEFQRETYVSRVSCPPIDPNEPLVRGALGLARQGIEKSLAKPDAVPRFFQAAIDLDLRLGNHEQALRLAKTALEKFPGHEKLSVGAAWALDGLGRTQEAIDLLAEVYDARDPQPLVLKEMARLFLHGDDRGARDPQSARVCIEHALGSFGAKDPAWNLLHAELLYAEGKLDDAVAEIERVVDKMQMRTSPYTDRLEAWTAEQRARREVRLPPPMAGR